MTTPEQRARDLLERLSDCTYYTDPQRLSAGDVVELANIFAEIEEKDRRISDLSQVVNLKSAECEKQRVEIEQYRNFVKRVAESGIENNVAWAWIGGQARQLLQTKDARYCHECDWSGPESEIIQHHAAGEYEEGPHDQCPRCHQIDTIDDTPPESGKGQ